jgi:hypothetical protein
MNAPTGNPLLSLGYDIPFDRIGAERPEQTEQTKLRRATG